MKISLLMIILGSVYCKQCLSVAECNEFVSAYPLFLYIQPVQCRFTENELNYCLTKCNSAPCDFPDFGSPYVSGYHYRLTNSNLSQPKHITRSRH